MLACFSRSWSKPFSCFSFSSPDECRRIAGAGGLGSIEGAFCAMWKVCCESESEALECRYEERSAIVQLKSGQVQDARRSQLTRKGRRTVIGGVQIEDSCQSRMAGHGASFDMFAKGNANRNECSQVPGHLSGHVLGRVLSPSDLPVVADALASLLIRHDCPCRDANLASQEQELLTLFAVLVNPALLQLLLPRQVRPSDAKPHV